jgi:hypothetical protein
MNTSFFMPFIKIAPKNLEWHRTIEPQNKELQNLEGNSFIILYSLLDVLLFKKEQFFN